MNTLDEVSAFHGHTCPGLALGFRVSQAALREFGARSGDEELVAIVENNSCAVDAVQFMTGCTFGKGNLIFHDHGKQVYTFIARPSGHTLRVAVDFTQPEESAEARAAWEKYSAGDRSPEVQKVVHERRSRKIQAILDAPDEELFKFDRTPAMLPHAAQIHTSIKCARCGEKTMETRIRLFRGRMLCMPCFEHEERTEE